MPNTKCAKKALRSSTRKRVFNKLTQAKMKQAYKSLRKNLAIENENSVKSLSSVFSALDKAVKSNFITRGKADRKKARATKAFKKTMQKEEAKSQVTV